jgi:hypothetical protein
LIVLAAGRPLELAQAGADGAARARSSLLTGFGGFREVV